MVDLGETCDGSNLGLANCLTETGLAFGTLGCASTCDAYDTSACLAAECGDDTVSAGALCVEPGQPVDIGANVLRVEALDIGAAFEHVVVLTGTPELLMYVNNGSGTFTQSSSAGVPGAIDLAVGEHSGDTQEDALVLTASTLSVWELSGGTWSVPGSSTAVSSAVAMGRGDQDGDGNPDVVVAGGSTELWVLPGQPSGGFGAAAVTTHSFSPSELKIARRDTTTVGAAEAWLLSFTGDVTLQDGNFATGGFDTRSLATLTNRFALLDVNFDDDLDMLVPNTSELAVLGGGAGPSLSNGVPFTGFGSILDVGTGDFDDDGARDIVVSDASRGIVFLLQRTGAWLGPVEFDVGVQPDRLTVADFNGDGVDDVAFTNVSGSPTLRALLSNP
jgi:hypothetical protein